jgi:membrane-bound ClpP family serine protease
MNVNTLVGALIAALILFTSTMVTLFAENPELTFGAIRQSAWVSIIGGAVVAFLKDYQAISTRRLVNKVTGSGDGGGTV